MKIESLSFLRTAAQTQDLWRNVKEEIVQCTEGYLIFDDTVINKKYANKIESVAPLFAKHSEGKEALVR
ncbi:MAG: hypothetical protein F6K24_23525 [Okeania sp. SIO2D1]|nr:hypothetical protein [Okeania sp. SIO2D1]